MDNSEERTAASSAEEAGSKHRHSSMNYKCSHIAAKYDRGYVNSYLMSEYLPEADLAFLTGTSPCLKHQTTINAINHDKIDAN
jgi:hypothetical protein